MQSQARGETFFFFFYFIPAGRRIGSLAIRAEVEFRFGGQVESCLFAGAKGRAADCRWKADAGRGASSLLTVSDWPAAPLCCSNGESGRPHRRRRASDGLP